MFVFSRLVAGLRSSVLVATFSVCLSTIAYFVPAPASALTLAPHAPLALFHFSGPRPTDLGVKDGQLKSCPSSPNCVSSQGSDPEHFIGAIAAADLDATLERIVALIDADESAEVITREGDYVYAEYTSKLMGFVDDVEFWIDREASDVAVRSASRLGESDLGVNRQRIEAIRTAL